MVMRQVNPEWNCYKLLAWVQSLGVDEADFLKALVSQLPPNPVVVNIGAAAGASAMAMVEERPDDIFIFSIDTDPNAGEPIELDKAGLAWLNRVVRILGKSGDVGQHFPCAVDMVFVDGDHSYAGVTNDLLAWMPKVKPGGILACHDYHSPSLFDVRRAVDECVHWAVAGDAGTIRAFLAPLTSYRGEA
jgi:predicted O-methyltransferase YrrM